MARLYRRPNKPGGTYYIDHFQDGDRVRRSLNTTVLKVAKKRRDEILAGTVDPRWGRDTTDISPNEFWEAYVEWAAMHKSPQTLQREATHWEQFVHYVRPKTLGSVTRRQVDHFKTRLSKSQGLANVTVNDTLRRMQALYNRAAKMGLYVGDNPFEGFDRLPVEEKPPQYLTAEQRDAVIETASTHSRDVYLFCALCLYAGLRTKEAVSARWEWVDFEQGAITVQGDDAGEFRTKGKQFRTVPLHDSLRAILEPLSRPEGFITLPEKTEPGKWRIRYEPKRAFTKVVKAAGVPWCTPHILRHTFAALLVSSGVSLYKVQRWLGHKSPKTTMIYAHLAPHDDDINRI